MPQARAVLQATDGLTSVFFAPTLGWRLFRDYVFLPILRRKTVQRAVMLKMSQLRINYRTSRLSRQEGRRGWFGTKLKAGDRAPDVAFRDSLSQKNVTLFDLLGPLRPVVLLGAAKPSAERQRLIAELCKRDLEVRVIASPEDESSPNDPRCIHDTHGSFRKIYGMKGEFLCLIRPDGHIGLFQQRIDLSSLRSYLEMLGRPRQKMAKPRKVQVLLGDSLEEMGLFEAVHTGFPRFARRMEIHVVHAILTQRRKGAKV